MSTILSLMDLRSLPKIELHLHQHNEIVADEDVLSPGARASLEDVGTGLGFICAVALLVSCFGRAARLFAAAPIPEGREARDVERRALEIAGGERQA